MTRPPRWTAPAALACLPVVVALARFAGRGVVLDGDEAVFAMQAADAAGGGFPTVGLYSWNGWNHPGPVAFYLFAPFHWLADGASWGILVGVAAWSAATMVLTGWLAQRRTPPGGALGGVGDWTMICLSIQSATWIAVGGAGVIDPWTPNLAASLVVPFLVALWGLAEGDVAATWAAAAIGAIAPQLHVGYAPLVGVGAITALLLAHRAGAGFVRRTVAGAAVMGVALWFPVIVDAVTGRTGNLATLARYFRSATPPPAGLGEGARIMAGELSPWPTWVTGPRPLGLFLEARQASVLWLVPLGVALVVALVVRRTPALVIGAASVVTATVACSQLRGFRYHYLVYWRAPIVLFAVAAAVAALVPAGTGRRWGGVRRAWFSFAAIAVLGASVIVTTWSASRADRVTRHGDAVGEVAGSLAAHLADEPTTGPVLLRLGDGGVVGALPGVLRDLRLRGVDARVDPDLEWVVGDRSIDQATVSEIWYVTDNGWSLSLLTADPAGRLLVERTPYDPATEARVRELQASIAQRLRAAGRADAIRSLDSVLVGLALAGIAGPDPADVAELTRLNGRLAGDGSRFGVVAFPPDHMVDVWWPLEAL